MGTVYLSLLTTGYGDVQEFCFFLLENAQCEKEVNVAMLSLLQGRKWYLWPKVPCFGRLGTELACY